MSITNDIFDEDVKPFELNEMNNDNNQTHWISLSGDDAFFGTLPQSNFNFEEIPPSIILQESNYATENDPLSSGIPHQLNNVELSQEINTSNPIYYNPEYIMHHDNIYASNFMHSRPVFIHDSLPNYYLINYDPVNSHLVNCDYNSSFQVYDDTHGNFIPEQTIPTNENPFYPNVSYVVDSTGPYENIKQEQNSYPVEQVINNKKNDDETTMLDVNHNVVEDQIDDDKENVMSKKGEEIQGINPRNRFQRFPIKLWNLATDPSFEPIKWSTDGMSLIIDENGLEPFLGYFFRSKKFSSFLRQLHLYGFRKVNRKAKIDRSNEMTYQYGISEYQCCFFQRDKFDLIKNVRRFYGHSPQTIQNINDFNQGPSSLSSESSLISFEIEANSQNSISINDHQLEDSRCIQNSEFRDTFQHIENQDFIFYGFPSSVSHHYD